MIRENSTRIYYDSNIGDKVMVRINQACKYETPFTGTYENFQTWTNVTITILTGAVTSRINICRTKPDRNPDLD